MNWCWALEQANAGVALTYNFGGNYCGNPLVYVFADAKSMQAVESFLQPFSEQHSILVRIALDNLVADLLVIGMLTSNQPNYTTVVGNAQWFVHAYNFQPVRVVVIVEDLNTRPMPYRTTAQAFPGVLFVPEVSAVTRVMNALVRAFADKDGFEAALFFTSLSAARFAPEGQGTQYGPSSSPS